MRMINTMIYPFKWLANTRLKHIGFALSLISVTAVVLFGLLSETAMAADPKLVVTPQPIARGSVTLGQDYIGVQSITMQADTGNINVTAITINEHGDGTASTNIESAYLYKETNSRSGFQGPNSPGVTPDTLLQTQTFPAGEETVTFGSLSETISTTPVAYYIVYTLRNTATVGSTLGSRLTDASAITVDIPATVSPFANRESRLLTVVTTPHSGYGQTNLCATCHLTHLAPDFSNETTLTAGTENSTNRILNKAYLESPDVVNTTSHQTYNLLCEACHDGTGANTNIKSHYDGSAKVPGHFTKRASTKDANSPNPGWSPPPAGKQYNAGVKIPCMVCHGVHGSNKSNHKMLADGLYDYALGTGWTDPNGNGKIDNDDERCVVCHEPATNSTTESTRTGTVMGIDMTMPTTHDRTSNCLGCHGNTSGSGAHNMELAPDSCSSCHLEIHQRATNQVAGIHSTHTISSDSNNVYPTPYGSGTCTGMCHSNHIHTVAANNTWFDAINHVSTSTVPFTDYSATAPYGLCLSCHTTERTGTSAGINTTTTAVSQSLYETSAHNYMYDNHIYPWDSSVFKINCVKCHRDSDTTTAQSKYGPHASEYKKLSFAGVDKVNGYVEEGICYKCHSVDAAKNPNGASGYDFYNVVTMITKALDIDSVFTKTYRHPTYAVSGKHLKMAINENPIDLAWSTDADFNQRHAECEDCHNMHAAKTGTHAQGTNAASGALAGVPGVQPTGGTWPDTAGATWVEKRDPTSWEKVNSISYEWQLCLKCHSSYTTQPKLYSWGANADAGIEANQQTNMALEFNPNNPGYHAVIGASKTTTGTFVNGWTNTDQMYCSDCHRSETSTDPAGPHGSNNQYVLLAPWSTSTGASGTDSDLCFSCHDRDVYGGGINSTSSASGFSDGIKNLHNLGDTLGSKHRQVCVSCHNFIPHGWQKKKLLVETGDGVPYNNGSKLVVNNWDSSGNWQKTSCGDGSVVGCH